MKASEGVADLCQLNRLGETDVLQNLKLRYARQKIYTSVTARVLIAVNPYAEIQNSQSEDTMHKYQQEKIHQEGLLGSNNLSPHTFTVANSAFHNVTSTEKNQSKRVSPRLRCRQHCRGEALPQFQWFVREANPKV